MLSTSTVKSSLSASSDLSIPERWKWVLEIFDGAHLPKLGLPVRWEETQQGHTLKAFDPETNSTIDVVTGIITRHKRSPVDFICSTKDKTPMPGTQAPAAVRYTRYTEPKLNSAIVTDSSGQHLVPCIVHGDYVKVEALSADHMQAKSEIMRRQKALVDKLNNESEFAEFVINQEGMDKFFVKIDEQYYGTLFFYELYFNDIDNIWLICDACNREKAAQETLTWLKEQWLYGQEFLDYLGMIKDPAIIAKAQNNNGLAQVAIEWFWQRHAHYISVTKRLLQDVTTPIQILNKHVDHVVGSGNQKRAERLQASLDAKLLLLESIAQAPGLGMPRQSSESPASSSDDEARLHLTGDDGNPTHISSDQYTSVMRRVADRLPTTTRQLAIVEFQKEVEMDKIENNKKRPLSTDSNEDEFYSEPKSKRPRK
jgi:hypothetical protein